jgi:hypothetical protein
MFDFFDFIKDSGLVTVIGMLAVFFLTRSYDSRQQKDAFNERFFFDVYPRRLGVYEDVISGLQGMIETDPNEARDATGLDVSRTIIEKIHALDTLIARLSLFGSPRAIEFLKRLRKFMFEMQDKCVSNPLSTE